MRDRPLVSIITPTYSRAQYLARTIQSVLAQTYPHWEHIVIDDGSTDNTEEVVASFHDPRIVYLKQERVGLERLGETYNKVLGIARGEFVATLDDDDLFPPDKLEYQLQSFQESSVILSYGPVVLIDRQDKAVGTAGRFPIKRDVRLNNPPGTILKTLLFRNFIDPVSVIIRRSALRSIGGFHQAAGSLYVDYPTFLHLSLLGRFACVKRPVGMYRRHASQATYQRMRQIVLSSGSLAEAFLSRVLAEGLVPENLIGLDDLRRHNENMREYCNLLEARIHLLEGQWPQARRQLTQLTRARWRPLRAAAWAGLASSHLHLNLEWAFRLLGKHSFTA